MRRFAEWFKQLSTGKQYAVVFAGLFLLLALIGAANGGSSSNSDKTSADQKPAAVQSASKNSEPVDEPDTGRMSGGEYDDLKLFNEAFTDEVQQFVGPLSGKCNSLVQLHEFAAASDCISNAYKGLESKAGAAYATYSDLIKATAKGCRRAMVRLRSALDQFTTAMQRVKTLGENLTLDVAAAKFASSRMATLARRYAARALHSLAVCEPA